jgi:hypothetical protein
VRTASRERRRSFEIGSLQLRWRKGQNPAGCGV